MAVRGINPLEKHVEKIFLALAAAGLTGVVAWQVAGGSGTVKVNGVDVPADQAYASLESKAKTLQTQIRDANPPLSDKLKSLVDPRDAFKKSLAARVAPQDQIDFQPAGPKIAIGGVNNNAEGNYAVPNLPASVKPIAHAFMSTVNDAEVTAYPELAKYMPPKAPMDKAAVSVQTTIDPKAIRAALEQDPDGAGPLQALLRAWWDKTEVVAVELVRQEMQPDGSWGGESATPALPGRANFAPALASPELNGASLTQIVNDASAAFDDVLRPQWYRRAELNGMYAGDAWQEPAQAGATTGGGANQGQADAQRKLREVNEEISRTERAIENLNKQPAPRQPAGGGGGGGGGGRRPTGGGGGGGGGLGGGAAPPPKVDPKEEQLKQLQRRLEDAKRRKQELEKQLGGGNAAPTGENKPVTRENDMSVLLSASGPVSVWNHDIDAKRGATYRYQLRIKVNNPLYNRAMQLKEHQEVAKSPTLTIPCADWSDPVRVDDEVYCFITGANSGANNPGGTGLGTAQANLLFFTWGYWRSDLVTLEPGDGMVARWKVPDETKLAAAPAAPVPAAPNAPAGGGGGRRGGAAAAGGGGGAAPPPANPAQNNAPAGTPLPTKEITRERDAFLLDVVQSPVSHTNPGSKTPIFSFLALIRDIDKSIVARDPDDDKNSPLFAALMDSVTKGHEQLAGHGVAVQPGGNAPVPPPPNAPVNPPGLNPGRGGG